MGIVYTTPSGGGVSSSDVTATVADVLKGKRTITSDSNDEVVEGTMPNCGAKTASLNCGGSYTIPAGYHNGSGKVSANSLSSQTSGTAAAGNILKDKTAWVNGNKITGTIASQAGQTITPLRTQQTISCSGKYMTGDIIVNAIPSNYLDPGTWQVFRNGAFSYGFGWAPYLYFRKSTSFTASKTSASSKDDMSTLHSGGNIQILNKVIPGGVFSSLKMQIGFTNRSSKDLDFCLDYFILNESNKLKIVRTQKLITIPYDGVYHLFSINDNIYDPSPGESYILGFSISHNLKSAVLDSLSFTTN